MRRNLGCFFRKEFLGLPDDVKAAECFTIHFPNVGVHWHMRNKPCSKVAHHLNGFDYHSPTVIVDMNLAHLLTRSFDYNWTRSWCHRTSATQFIGHQHSRFSIFLSAASWDASECDRKERQISVSSALGIRQWSWINQQRILTREPVPDSFPVVLLTQSRMHPICNSSLEFSAF